MLVQEKEAKDLLRQGLLVALATETVFGIAADIHQESALLSLYNLKKRKSTKPLVIQVSHQKEVLPFLSHIPFDLEKLMDHFWPGPLTLVLPVHDKMLSGLITANKPFAGFRITAHEETRRFIADYGPLALTSANISGEKDLMNAEEVEKVFGKDFPILSTSQKECLGVASTVLAYVDQFWVVVRLGALTLEHLREVLGYYPLVVADLDLKAQTFTTRPQLHLKEEPYNGSIEVVLGFKNKTYPLAKHIHYLGDLKKPRGLKKQFAKVFQEIQEKAYPHIWVDLDFPKEGPLKDLAKLLQHAVMTSL